MWRKGGKQQRRNSERPQPLEGSLRTLLCVLKVSHPDINHQAKLDGLSQRECDRERLTWLSAVQ